MLSSRSLPLLTSIRRPLHLHHLPNLSPTTHTIKLSSLAGYSPMSQPLPNPNSKASPDAYNPGKSGPSIGVDSNTAGGGVWANTSAKNEKLTELKGEIPFLHRPSSSSLDPELENLKSPGLDDMCSNLRERMDLEIMDSCRIVMDVGDICPAVVDYEVFPELASFLRTARTDVDGSENKTFKNVKEYKALLTKASNVLLNEIETIDKLVSSQYPFNPALEKSVSLLKKEALKPKKKGNVFQRIIGTAPEALASDVLVEPFWLKGVIDFAGVVDADDANLDTPYSPTSSSSPSPSSSPSSSPSLKSTSASTGINSKPYQMPHGEKTRPTKDSHIQTDIFLPSLLQQMQSIPITAITSIPGTPVGKSNFDVNTPEFKGFLFECMVKWYRLRLALSCVDVLINKYAELSIVDDADVDRLAFSTMEGSGITVGDVGVRSSGEIGISVSNVIKVIESYAYKGGEERIKDMWDLCDCDNDGLLEEKEMERVVRIHEEPFTKTVEAFLSGVISNLDEDKLKKETTSNKKHKKYLTELLKKNLKVHFNTELEAPHRIRCCYAWADKEHQGGKFQAVHVSDDLAGRKRYVELLPKISYAEFLVVQREQFGQLEWLGGSYMKSLREDVLIRQGKGRQNRELYRQTAAFVVVVGGIDFIIGIM